MHLVHERAQELRLVRVDVGDIGVGLYELGEKGEGEERGFEAIELAKLQIDNVAHVLVVLVGQFVSPFQ